MESKEHKLSNCELEKERRKKMQKRFGKGTKKGNGLKYQKIDQSTMLIIKY